MQSKTKIKLLSLLISMICLSGCSRLSWNSFFNSSLSINDSIYSQGELSILDSEYIKVDVEGVQLQTHNLNLYVGESYYLIKNIIPINATNQNVRWEVEYDDIIKIDDNGQITGLESGQTNVAVVTEEGNFSDVCLVNVVSPGDNKDVIKTGMSQTIENYIDNNLYTVSSCPTVGNPKVLIIPIWFTDSSTFIDSNNKEVIRNDINIAFFGSDEETGWKSVKTYYEALSGNICSLRGTVSTWFECGESVSEFYRGYGPTDNLVVGAVNWYFKNNPNDDRRNYDTDSDGFLDGVVLIYAAPDYRSWTKPSYDNLWAYVYWLQNKSTDKSSPIPNAYLWASYTFMYNSALSRTKTGKTSYGGGDTTYCNVDSHTYIHEFGHLFGLEDYYDYSEICSPAGGFSMQDLNIGSHDPFSALELGWVNPYIPTESCTIELKSFQSSHEVILLTPSWNEFNSPFDEYLLIELYTPDYLNEMDCLHYYSRSYPKGPSTIGIRLWHVDARLLYVDSTDRFGKFKYSASNVTKNADYKSRYGLHTMMANSYTIDENATLLGSNYVNYNLLQLIRNSSLATYKPKDDMTNRDLFTDGSSFKMADFKKQFYALNQGGYLNSGVELGWEFSVSIKGNGNDAKAIIECTKQ